MTMYYYNTEVSREILSLGSVLREHFTDKPKLNFTKFMKVLDSLIYAYVLNHHNNTNSGIILGLDRRSVIEVSQERIDYFIAKIVDDRFIHSLVALGFPSILADTLLTVIKKRLYFLYFEVRKNVLRILRHELAYVIINSKVKNEIANTNRTNHMKISLDLQVSTYLISKFA